MAKFKVGDLIRMSTIDDPNYKRNGYWKVLKVQKYSYVLWSYINNTHINQKRCKEYLKYYKYPNMMTFIDKCYRLLTAAEKVLYVHKSK